MAHFDKIEFNKLANVHAKLCISIFIPTHHFRETSLIDQDVLIFKNQLKTVRAELRLRSIDENLQDQFLRPLENLLEDSDFWRHQNNCLAIFLSEGFFQTYELSITCSSLVYVASTFFLKPLIPLLYEDGKFLILTLELNKVQLYLYTGEDISHIPLPHKTPSRLEEAVGYDFEEKSLQIRSQQHGDKRSVYHGQGEGKEDRKNEILRFFREINKGVAAVVGDQKYPMILAGIEYLVPIYRKANTYKNLWETPLILHPSDLHVEEILRRARELMMPIWKRGFSTKSNQFKQLEKTSKVAIGISEILPLAYQGNIDSLFIQTHYETWGVFDPEKKSVRLDKNKNLINTSLTNLAAIQVILKGGKVFLVDEEQMPIDKAEIVSLNRH